MEQIAALTSPLNNFVEMLSLLLILVFVLALTYFVTKWIAGYQKGQMHNRNLQVIETLKITTNKYIQIVKAGNEYLVISIGKDEICLLTKLKEEQLEKLPAEEFQKEFPGGEFQDILEKVKKHLPKK